MNYWSIMLVSTLITSQSVFAQKDSSGIYKTAEDFQQRKLSYAINCKTEKHKINPNVIFKDSKVKVKHDVTTYELKKSEIFGFRTCAGKEFRFVDEKESKFYDIGEDVTNFRETHSYPKDLENLLYFIKMSTCV